MKTEPRNSQPLDLKKEKYAGNTNPKPSKKDLPVPKIFITNYNREESKEFKKSNKHPE